MQENNTSTYNRQSREILPPMLTMTTAAKQHQLYNYNRQSMKISPPMVNTDHCKKTTHQLYNYNRQSREILPPMLTITTTSTTDAHSILNGVTHPLRYIIVTADGAGVENFCFRKQTPQGTSHNFYTPPQQHWMRILIVRPCAWAWVCLCVGG